MPGPYLRSTMLLTLKTQFTSEELAKECAFQAKEGGPDVFDDKTLKFMIDNLLQDRRIAERKAQKEAAQ